MSHSNRNKPGKLVARSMETVYLVVWQPRYKKHRFSTNHNIRNTLYGDQDKTRQDKL